MNQERFRIVLAVGILQSNHVSGLCRAWALNRRRRVLRSNLRFGHTVNSNLVALFRIVADVPEVQVRAASSGPRSDGHVFPIYRCCAGDSPDAAMFSLAVESIDERIIAAVIVSPENA